MNEPTVDPGRHSEPRSALEMARTLTIEDIAGYFDAKRAFEKCPQCAANAWEAPDPGVTGLSDLMLVPAVRGLPLSTIPALVLTCLNCGFLRMHSAILIAKWKMTQGEAR